MRSEHLDEDSVREIARQVISAVTHCFNHGVDHRDISLDNLYLDLDTRQVKLAGFQHSTVLSVLPHTLKPFPSSSPSSCPPELYHTGFCTAHSAAVWSLGCLMFELLSGYPPILSSADAAMGNVRWEMLPPYSVSPDVYSLLLECLNPEQKYRISFEKLANHYWIINELSLIHI